MGLHIFSDKELSWELLSELSLHNISVIQSVLSKKYIKDIDLFDKRGSQNKIFLPRELEIHDTLHFIGTAPDNSRKAITIVKKYRRLLIVKELTEWMPLLTLLVFIHKHEFTYNISNLPDNLANYYNIEKSTNPLIAKTPTRINHGDLASPKLTPLFNQHWKNFITLLQTAEI